LVELPTASLGPVHMTS